MTLSLRHLPARLLLVLILPFLLSAAAPADRPTPGYVRVRLETSMGNIVVALDARRAPRTTANFLIYVDDGRLDGTSFYRAARSRSNAHTGFVQGGIGTDARRIYFPTAPLERTTETGLRHLDGTISMARHRDPDSATGNFSIQIGPNPTLDARPGYDGYAAFGQVVSGMNVVRRILALETCCGRGMMRGQMIRNRVTLIRAVRLDGHARPSGQPKPWEIGRPRR